MKGLPSFPRQAISNYESWRDFVGEPAVRPPVLRSTADYSTMAAAARAEYDDERKRYHSRFGPLETPQLQTIQHDLLRLAARNFNAPPGARPGGAIDGFPTTGKSTIAMQLGRRYEGLVRKQFEIPGDLPNGDLYVPVVYVTLPSNVTIKGFNWQVLDFFNYPAPKSASEDWLSRQIVRCAQNCGTSMFIVDDVHFVRMKNRSGVTINNHFKYLANCISATFIYAGIDLEGSHLFSEGAVNRIRAALSQTKHRFRRYDLKPFESNTVEYLGLLASFERHLLLMKHDPGTLVEKLAAYVHDRTAGYIGAISDLIREGANLAIDLGDECLSRRLLQRVTLDHAAEEHRAVTGARKPTVRT